MFDFTPPSATSPSGASPRFLAVSFITRLDPTLFSAAKRIGGDDGAALACALMDMVADGAVDPLHWPLDEMIDLLRRPMAARDAQVSQLLRQLERIQRQIEERM